MQFNTFAATALLLAFSQIHALPTATTPDPIPSTDLADYQVLPTIIESINIVPVPNNNKVRDNLAKRGYWWGKTCDPAVYPGGNVYCDTSDHSGVSACFISYFLSLH